MVRVVSAGSAAGCVLRESEQFFQVAAVQRFRVEVFEHRAAVYVRRVRIRWWSSSASCPRARGCRVAARSRRTCRQNRRQPAAEPHCAPTGRHRRSCRNACSSISTSMAGLNGRNARLLLEHPREHGLAGEIKRTNVTRIEFRMLAAHALCGPANRRFQLTVGVDELLQRPVQRAGGGGVHDRRRGIRQTVPPNRSEADPSPSRNAWSRIQCTRSKLGFMPKSDPKHLEAFHRERIAVRQC